MGIAVASHHMNISIGEKIDNLTIYKIVDDKVRVIDPFGCSTIIAKEALLETKAEECNKRLKFAELLIKTRETHTNE